MSFFGKKEVSENWIQFFLFRLRFQNFPFQKNKEEKKEREICLSFFSTSGKRKKQGMVSHRKPDHITDYSLGPDDSR